MIETDTSMVGLEWDRTVSGAGQILSDMHSDVLYDRKLTERLKT